MTHTKHKHTKKQNIMSNWQWCHLPKLSWPIISSHRITIFLKFGIILQIVWLYLILSFMKNSIIFKKIIEVLWRRAGQPSPVFLPGESYSPRGGKESDRIEQRSTHRSIVDLQCCIKTASYYNHKSLPFFFTQKIQWVILPG